MKYLILSQTTGSPGSKDRSDLNFILVQSVLRSDSSLIEAYKNLKIYVNERFNIFKGRDLIVYSDMHVRVCVFSC